MKIDTHLNDTMQKDLVSPNQGLSESDIKIIKELIRKNSEIEKSFRLLSSQINIDHITREFTRINEAMLSKAGLPDLNGLRDSISELQKQSNYIKDQVNTIVEDKSAQEDIIQIKRRLETLSSMVYAMKHLDEGSPNALARNPPIDSSKFIDQQAFNDNKSNTNKQFQEVHEELNEFRRAHEELRTALKNKVTDKDLKNSEDYILSKMEEFKAACGKKFAEKNETTKNLRYLDQQIKYIIDVYIKKIDKADNWLLAKKPIGGYTCASCEAYIGELKDSTNNQYIPWNRYPLRDPSDKLYRIGHGFSKILGMINVDAATHKREGSFPTAKDFFIEQQSENNSQSKPDISLPQLKTNKKKNHANMSADDIGDEAEAATDGEEQSQPKM